MTNVIPFPRRKLTAADFSPVAGSYRLPDRRTRPRLAPASTDRDPLVLAPGMHVSYPMRHGVCTLLVECVRPDGSLLVMSSDGFSEWCSGMPPTARAATPDEIRTFERIRGGRIAPIAYE